MVVKLAATKVYRGPEAARYSTPPFLRVSLRSFHSMYSFHWDDLVLNDLYKNFPSQVSIWASLKVNKNTNFSTVVDSKERLKGQVCFGAYEIQLQERLKHRNTIGCLDEYAAQNSKYARPPNPPQPPSSSVTLNMIPPWNIHTVKQSMPRSGPMAVLEIGSLPLNSLNSPNLHTSWSH